MHWRFALLLLILMAACSDEDRGSVLATRSRTLLENKILGTWGWSYYLSRDTVTFKSDLSFSGVMDGAAYNGDFVLDNDSLLRLHRIMTLFGKPTAEDFVYQVISLDNATLELRSSSRVSIYQKIR